MEITSATPLISIIIPTYNRADLLKESLESLVGQSIPKHQYEVVVIDDGSTDATPDVCKRLSSKLELKYFRLKHSGISAAKNLGIFTSSGPILLFFDDDDIADENLLQQHLIAHEKYPQENIAILGHTTWAPSLHVTELMHYVTNIGHFLFSYSNLGDEQTLDFTYFWGGRSSCKRALLVRHGIFKQGFQFGSEDIELGYRLSKFGLKVIFHRDAVQYMNRPITYDEFCQRCERQGISQVLFSDLHSDPVIQQYCQVVDADEKWLEMKWSLEEKVSRVHEIESLLALQPKAEEKKLLLEELWGLYRWTFNAFKIKGIVETWNLSDAQRAGRQVALAI